MHHSTTTQGLRIREKVAVQPPIHAFDLDTGINARLRYSIVLGKCNYCLRVCVTADMCRSAAFMQKEARPAKSHQPFARLIGHFVSFPMQHRCRPGTPNGGVYTVWTACVCLFVLLHFYFAWFAPLVVRQWQAPNLDPGEWREESSPSKRH